MRVLSDASEVRAVLRQVAPDLIILDLAQFDLDVLDEEEVRPVVVVGRKSEAPQILRALRRGAHDFLQAPFDEPTAVRAVERALQDVHLRRERERLMTQLRHAQRRLAVQAKNWTALNDIAQAITSAHEEAEVFRRVMAGVNRILQVEAGSILVRDPETDELEFRVTIKGDEARFSDFHLKPGQGIAGWVAQRGEPLLIPDVRQDERFYTAVDDATGFRSHSILCVPLYVKAQVIGVLEVINKRQGPAAPAFTSDDQELLETLASWVAVAVENLRLNRAARNVAVFTTLRQAVATLAHHINNRLMALSLELDSLESSGQVSPQSFSKLVASAHHYIQEVSAVIRAMDRLEELRTISYVGTEEMLDIEKALEEQLRRIENERW
jgi:GAF domain-containing protein